MKLLFLRNEGLHCENSIYLFFSKKSTFYIRFMCMNSFTFALSVEMTISYVQLDTKHKYLLIQLCTSHVY